MHGALYDFGYGLSYTTFEYSSLKLSSKTISPSDSVEVSFTLRNTGSRKGDEVVQLYIRDVLSSITVYEKVLRGFERVSLEPGESKEVSFTLAPKDLGLLDVDFRRIVEPGEFEIMIGASSKDIRLSEKLLVDDGGDTAHVTYPDDASYVKTTFPAKIGVSEDATVSVAEGKMIGSLGINWGGLEQTALSKSCGPMAAGSSCLFIGDRYQLLTKRSGKSILLSLSAPARSVWP